jgi:hypothetical protein
VCTSCSQAIQDIKVVKDQTKHLQTITQEVKDLSKNCIRQVGELQEKLHQKEKENADLRARLAIMTTQMQQFKWGAYTQAGPPKDLVISDSMLGEVDDTKLDSTKVISISGGRV